MASSYVYFFLIPWEKLLYSCFADGTGASNYRSCGTERHDDGLQFFVLLIPFVSALFSSYTQNYPKACMCFFCL